MQLSSLYLFLPWSNGSVLDHKPLPTVFESRREHIWKVVHLWLHFITFGGRSAHLAYYVQKRGRKTPIIIIIINIFFLIITQLEIMQNFSVFRTACLGLSHGLLCFLILCHSWHHFIGSLFNLASFSNSALLPIKLFLPENLRIYCSSFLQQASPECSVHLIYTCYLFPGLKHMPELVLFQLLSLLFRTHSLNMLSHQIE